LYATYRTPRTQLPVGIIAFRQLRQLQTLLRLLDTFLALVACVVLMETTLMTEMAANFQSGGIRALARVRKMKSKKIK